MTVVLYSTLAVLLASDGRTSPTEFLCGQRVASITMGGINQAASIETRANRAMAEGSITAASQVRDAALQAARLHMASAIVHQLTRAAARQIEQGLTLRY